MNTHEIPIEKLIPQRNPFIMVDRVERQEGEQIETSFMPISSNIFVHQGEFSESGLIENIAQSAAALVGLEYFLKNEPAPVGFIGAVDKVKNLHPAKAETPIKTVVTHLQKVMNITLIEGTVFQNDQALLSCKMKIVIDP